MSTTVGGARAEHVGGRTWLLTSTTEITFCLPHIEFGVGPYLQMQLSTIFVGIFYIVCDTFFKITTCFLVGVFSSASPLARCDIFLISHISSLRHSPEKSTKPFEL